MGHRLWATVQKYRFNTGEGAPIRNDFWQIFFKMRFLLLIGSIFVAAKKMRF